MKARLPLLLLATLVIAAYGVNSAMFSELSAIWRRLLAFHWMKSSELKSAL